MTPDPRRRTSTRSTRAGPSGRWRYRGSVFDSFEPRRRRPAPARIRSRRSSSPSAPTADYRLRAAGRAAARDPPARGRGPLADRRHRRLRARDRRPRRDPRARADRRRWREADVVVAHAGVGTALAALRGRQAARVLVPRRLAHGEHVDDHQTQIAGELGRRGLALSVDADALTLEHLLDGRRAPRQDAGGGSAVRRAGSGLDGLIPMSAPSDAACLPGEPATRA